MGGDTALAEANTNPTRHNPVGGQKIFDPFFGLTNFMEHLPRKLYGGEIRQLAKICGVVFTAKPRLVGGRWVETAWLPYLHLIKLLWG